MSEAGKRRGLHGAVQPGDGGLALFPWGLLGTVTVPLAILAFITYCRLFPPILFGDADYYAAALPALLSNALLYDPGSFQPHALPPPPFWDQAPSAAIFTPILLLPAGKLVWGLLLVACVLGGIAILMPQLRAGVVLYAPVMVALPPVIEGMAWGNLSSLVFLMLAIAWRWPRQAGWAIGIAAAAKALPLLMVVWLIGRRDWRGVGVALAIPTVLTGVVILLTSPSVVVDFVMLRLNQAPTPGLVPSGLSTIGMPGVVGWVLVFVVAAAATWKASFTLAMLATMLASPALLMHHLMQPLVPALGIWVPWLIARTRARA